MSLEAELRERGAPYRTAGGHHHATAGRVQVDCPRCSPGTGKYRLGLAVNLRGANCWVCGKIDVYEVLLPIFGADAGRLMKSLRGERAPEVARTGRLKLPEHGPLDLPHREYLRGRQFDPDALGPWDISGIGRHPKYPWRLLLPVHSRGGKVVSWTTRSIGDGDDAKYVSAPPEDEDQPARTQLYAQHLTRHAVIVHEGPLDAVATGPGAVATMGVAYTPAQLSLLADYPVRVVCFDSEPKAQQRARQLCDDLCVFSGSTVRVELDAHDAASAPETELRLLRRMLRG